MSRAVRVVVIAVAALTVVGTAIAIPFIVSGKREGAARERREDAAAKAASERRLRVDQAPHRGRATHAPRAPAAARRGAIIASLERAITADSRARFRAGRLPGPAVKSTICDPRSEQLADLQPDARRAGGVILACVAATTVGRRPGGARFALGFEFIAVTNWARGTFTWCKTNPPPGEKFGGARRAEVPLERACVNPAA